MLVWLAQAVLAWVWPRRVHVLGYSVSDCACRPPSSTTKLLDSNVLECSARRVYGAQRCFQSADVRICVINLLTTKICPLIVTINSLLRYNNCTSHFYFWNKLRKKLIIILLSVLSYALKIFFSMQCGDSYLSSLGDDKCLTFSVFTMWCLYTFYNSAAVIFRCFLCSPIVFPQVKRKHMHILYISNSLQFERCDLPLF